jgi:radical SAM superfamily enzyme YgiQ (UPF0313 family)
MRGHRLDKDFPVIKPSTSRWSILSVLEDCGPQGVRRLAKSAGFNGETDILLIAPLPSPSSPQKNEALGLFYIGESSRRFGFNVDYWDERHETNENEFWKKVSRANMVGFTAITGFQLSRFVTIASRIKERFPSKPIILGGPHATLTKPEMNLSDPLIDFLVFGEGELRLPALMRTFYEGDGMGLVDGIGYKTKSGDPIIQPSTHVPDPLKGHLVRAVSPWTIPYFAASATRDEMILPTSRGCPWSTDSCDFCSVGKQYLDSYRGFPFELWKADILAVHGKTPVRHIEPEDENSALAIKPQQPYLPFLKEIGATSHLHLRSDQLLDERSVQWMAEMGVRRIHIGVESGNERVLNGVMHKNERVEDHFVAARNLAKYGIEMVATYIVGNPTETWRETNDTLTLAEELKKVFPKGGYRATIYVLAALPGTPIYYTIERMHKFNEALSVVEGEMTMPGDKEETLRNLAKWYRTPTKAATIHPRLKSLDVSVNGHPKVADTVHSSLEDFLIEPKEKNLSKLKEETQKWLWPTPTTLRGWTSTSAAYNPFLPAHWNAIYPIAGIHHNKYHKTTQNFPGWKRFLIKPFEILCDVRYYFRFFKYAGAEIWTMGRLINWAAQRSVGSSLNVEHGRKVFEGYSETLAGH